MKDPLSISEMAAMHGVSRQTLIHYDKIGLFRPEVVKENGYRGYSLRQIPYLREICFLRALDIPLEDIRTHFEHRTPETAIAFLEQRSQAVRQEMERLEQTRRHLALRMSLYKTTREPAAKSFEPTLRYYPERRVTFVPFEPNITKEKLHYSLIQAWQMLCRGDQLPSGGFGTIIRRESARREDFLAGAGSYVMLPMEDDGYYAHSAITLPAGDYITMFKYAMPYQREPLDKLLAWMDREGCAPCGDIVDACILDTTFYSDTVQTDFCQLQIPLRYQKQD